MSAKNPAKNEKKVAIIGGGFIGLTLAYLLSKNKIETVLIEKGKQLGGLASGFKINGAALERYYHHLFKGDKDIQNLIAELGLAAELEWLPASMGIYADNKLHPFSGVFDLLRFKPLNIFERLRSGLVSLYLQKAGSEERFKKQSALEWCRRYYGKGVTKAIWEPLLKSKFGEHYDKVSMVWLWARLKDRGSSRPNPLKNEELGYLKGSLQRLVDLLEKKGKERGVKIYKNSGILDFENGGRIHKLVWRDGSGKVHQEKFTHLVATIPPEQFLEIFNAPRPYRDQWQDIQFIGAICLVLKLSSSLQPFYWTSINDPDAPFVALVEHTRLIGKEMFQGDHIVYLGKYLKTSDPLYQKSDTEIYNTALSFLKQLNPDFQPDWVLEKHLFKAPAAQHIVTKGYIPPKYETGIRNVYFAHFAQIFPHDRGTNYAVNQAKELYNLIKRNN